MWLWYNDSMENSFEKVGNGNNSGENPRADQFLEGWLELAKMEKNFREEAEEEVAEAVEEKEVEKGRGFGAFQMSEAEVTGEEDKRGSFDTSFCDFERGVFSVFDGAGARLNAGKAANVAKETLAKFLENEENKENEKVEKIEDISNLWTVISKINQEVMLQAEGGQTTGVIAKLNGDKMLFASVGDSRLYLEHGGEVKQITKDDAVTDEMLDRAEIHDERERKNYRDHGISKALGMLYGDRPSRGNLGEISVEKGDRIVLCSDGVTGDILEDQMSNEEISKILAEFSRDEDAAENLVRKSKKIDDRTAIVVTIEGKAEEKEGVKDLLIGDEVYGGYKVASIGYNDKSEAYDDIRQYRQGIDATTYHQNGRWYVIEK